MKEEILVRNLSILVEMSAFTLKIECAVKGDPYFCDTTGVKCVTFLYKVQKVNIIKKVQHYVCYFVYMSVKTS